MAKFEKPHANEFAELKREALANHAEEEWRKNILGNIANILRREPLRYRAYGPYWWILKREMLNQGIKDFGSHIDAEWYGNTDYGNSTINILAAWLYEDNGFSFRNIYSSDHNVTFLQGENEGEIDVRVYTLVDEDMEMLAIQNNLA